MKKFLITIFGVIVLSQGAIPMSNNSGRVYNYTVVCIDGYKYLMTSMGYAAINVVQVFEKSPAASSEWVKSDNTPQPAVCK